MIPTLDAIREAHANKLVSVRPHQLDDRLVICNYTPICTYSHAWDDTTRRCRGLILRLDKPWSEATRIEEVVALPLEKFFNYGEKDLYPTAPLVSVFEKLDGSLGILYRLNGELWIATRGSFESEQATWATHFLRTNYNQEWLRSLPNDLTLIFEIVYPENKIIVNYGERCDLVLLAIRSRLTGEEFDRHDVVAIANMFGFGYPKLHPVTSIPALLESSKTLGSDFEGWVCRFADGSRFKIKSRRYMEIAKALMGLSPKRVFDSMRDGTIRELEESAPEEVLPEIQEWRRQIQSQYDAILMRMQEVYEQAPKDDAKAFSFWVNAHHKDHAALLFAIYRNHDLVTAIWKWMDKRGVEL